MAVAMESEKYYCEKCGKTMAATKFYQYKTGGKCELCKACLTLHVNNFDPKTFLWILEKFDVPYIEAEWNDIRDKAYIKDPYKMTGMSVLGKYLAKMRLNQHATQTWADTERLALEAEAQAKLHGTAQEQKERRLEEMKSMLEQGAITQAQYDTYADTLIPESSPTPMLPPSSVAADPDFPVNDNPFEKVDLPDVGNDLTLDDKVYLATKWGKLYTAADWVWLEEKYNDFMNSFDIQGAARIDTLIQICKLSLKSNQALDSGDMESYSKLVKAYDALMKSAKFTEAQRKEENAGQFDSVGQVVRFAELNGGKIERYKIDTPLDLADSAIENLKRYTKDLIANDPSLAQQLENYIRRRENLDLEKQMQKDAEAQGLDSAERQVEDYENYNELLSEKTIEEKGDEE